MLKYHGLQTSEIAPHKCSTKSDRSKRKKLVTEPYLEPCQTFMTNFSATIADGVLLIIIFAKKFLRKV